MHGVYSVYEQSPLGAQDCFPSHRCVILTQPFLHLSSCNREVQHLCDSKGTKCEEHNHRCPGQLAQLGAGLHVVSPSSSSYRALLSFCCPSLCTLSSSCLLIPYFSCLSAFMLFFLISHFLPPLSPLLHPKCRLSLYCFT